jgi:hypothetical protein
MRISANFLSNDGNTQLNNILEVLVMGEADSPSILIPLNYDIFTTLDS